LDGTGKHIEEAVVPHELSQEQAMTLYVAMAKLQVMDTICYDAQRQVRPSSRCTTNVLQAVACTTVSALFAGVACHVEQWSLLHRIAAHGCCSCAAVGLLTDCVLLCVQGRFSFYMTCTGAQGGQQLAPEPLVGLRLNSHSVVVCKNLDCTVQPLQLLTMMM
jgi:hypothetical protein